MMKKHLTIAACSLLAVLTTFAVLYFTGIIFKKASPAGDKPAIQDNVQVSDLNLSDIKITPLVSDSAGVDAASAFRLTYSGSLDEKFLKASLKVNPDQEYTLKKDEGNSYLLNFSNPLKSNSLYKFEIKDGVTGSFRSWAFQTKQSFSIIRTLPRNQAIQVPVDSGIEITLNSENAENMENYFEITPAVKGRFEYHLKTVVFVPEKLEYGTVYTVTIKKGLGFKGSSEKLTGDYSFSFQTAAKVDNSSNNLYFSFADTSYNFTTEKTPALQVYASEDTLKLSAKVEIYKYPDARRYTEDLKKYESLPYWAVADFQRKTFDTAGLEKVAAFDSKLAKNENNYWYETYLVLPEKLPQGYYLARVNLNGKDYYVQIQINNLSVYIMITNNQTLLWVNDSATGKPVEGALVSGAGSEGSLKTSAEGLATIDGDFSKNSENRNYYFNITDSKNPVFVARVSSRNYYYYNRYNNNNLMNTYWSYMYLDRGMYLPVDKVNVWGLVKPRDNGAKPGSLTLELVSNNYYLNENINEAVIDTKQVDLSGFGTFTGSFELSGYSPGSYIINVKSNGQTISSSYFQVLEYSKPAYRIDLTPSKKIMYSWEKANMDIRASFFEGSPLSGLEVSYNYSLTYPGNNGSAGKLTCDSNGFATMALNTTTGVNTWRPQQLYFYANSAKAEEEEIRANSNIMVFPRDTMLEATSSMDGSNCNIKISTNKIDLSKLDTENRWYYSEDEYRGNPTDTNVEVKLYEKYWVSRETGEYYDFINKKKVKKYEYQEQQKLVNTYNLKTVNGKASLSFTAEKEKSYYIEASYKDSTGRQTVETQYIYNWQFNPYNNNTYSISPVKNKYSFKKGEAVDLQVMKGSGTAVPDEKGKFLYVKLKNGIINSDISTKGKYNFTYSDEDIPNVFVKAVYFDGVNVYDAGIMNLNYDYSKEKLDISVQPDKASYKPGDTVTLDIDTKDSAGSPCKSEVNISAVDEAFFSVMDQYVDTLSTIYGASVSSGLITDYFSYKSPEERGTGAEGGEGGDSMSIRKDFKDNAFFGTVTTDSTGHAKISFKLPDNLTTWRVTCQAVTGDLKAGSKRISVTSKLPFFVDTIFNKIFMAGDSPSILVRANGTNLKSTDDVNFTVVVKDGSGVNKSYSASAKGNTVVDVPVGKLEEGSYTVTVKGTCGNLKDGLERSFKVVPEILQAARLDYSTLSENVKLPGSASSLTTLSFLNKDASALYNELLSLYWTWGERLDQKLSRIVAGDLLNKYFGEEFTSDEPEDLSRYQTNDGGLALLTYDSSSPELSAKICAFIKDKIDGNSLSSYFYNILNNKDSTAADVAYSYWGLASLGKPVLTDIHNLLASSPNLELEEKLVLGIALASIGDYDGAEKIYKDAMAQNSVTEGNMTFIKTNGSRDDMTKLTALCSIIALKLDQPEKQNLFAYANANSTSELLTNLEKLIYITSYIPDVKQECSFSYELDGKKQAVALKNNDKYELILTPEKLASISFSNIKGNISVVSSHTGHVKDMIPTSNALIGINRSYQVDGKTVTAFNRSDFIKIVLKPSFTEKSPDGYYQITDVLPAGLKYVAMYQNEKDNIYPDEVSGQRVSFGLRYDKNYNKTKDIVYYARAVSPGTFTADSAFIKYSENNICSFAPKLEITIN